MPAWLLPALMSAGSLGASMWATGGRESQWRRMMAAIAEMQSPERILGDTNKLYQGYLSSPMFSAAKMNMMSGAQQAARALNASSLGSGVTGGMSALSRSIGKSLPGMGLAQLRSGLYSQANQMAMQNLRDRIAAAQGAMSQPSGRETMVGSLLGAMGPLLKQLMTQRGAVNATAGSPTAGTYNPFNVGGIGSQMQIPVPDLGLVRQGWLR